MILKGIILTLIIIICGLLTIIGLILTIVKRNNKRVRNIWLTVFAISLIMSGSTAVYTAIKVVDNTINTSIELKDAVVEGAMEGLAETMTDNREYLINTIKNNSQIELLKSYVPDSLKNKVPSTFYTHFGFRDSYRFPLVYPYSIHCVDIVDYGQINDERDAVDITWSDDGVKQLQVYGITDFTFDQNLLLAKISSQSENTDKGYIILHFMTQETEQFDEEQELMRRAKELGFFGQDTLMTIKEYNRLF